MGTGVMACAPERPATGEVFITDALAQRLPKRSNYQQEKQALQELAARMAGDRADVLPHFVDLAMEMTGAVAAGLSLYDADTAPDIFRWQCLRGLLAQFENATTPRNDSPCGVTLDRNAPVLVSHPERMYGWIAAHDLVLAEVLLVPLFIGGAEPLGTLWMVGDTEGHFDSGDARAASELAAFLGIALRMLRDEDQLRRALEEQETVAKEMSHRLKNLFAMTDGMIHASARNADTPDAMAEALSGRIHALASAHSLVRRKVSELGSASEVIDLGELLRAVLRPHDRVDEHGLSRFSIEGTPISCGDHATNGVALFIHELATNAAKYGALKTKNGRIRVAWSQETDKLALTWEETGGPRIESAPTTSGFGSVLAQRIVTSQFRGRLERDWRPEGLMVTMVFRLDKLSA